MNRIVAICLLKNEDRFLDRVLANICEFCDEILLADHQSTDGTPDIAKAWTDRCGHIQYRRIRDPGESHEWVRTYADSPTWIFGVDGDEIYDPAGLLRLRPKLCAGAYDEYRQIYGHALHCERIDEDKLLAYGYTTPPCRTITKMYNFNAIHDWEGPCPERTHGGRILFKDSHTADDNLWLYRDVPWDEADFRCLHTVFLPRSSRDADDEQARQNLSELNRASLLQRGLNRVRKPPASTYKYEKYRKGPLVEKNVEAFFPGELKS